jgi:hypothetical protein
MSAAAPPSSHDSHEAACCLWAVCGLLLGLALHAPLAWADTSERYLVVTQGSTAGAMEVHTATTAAART